VEWVRYYEGEERRRGTPPKEIALIGVRRAIKDCREAKLLTDFWESLTMEDVIMLSTEWDWNLALEVAKEESFEEGIEKGLQKGIQKGLQKGLAEGIGLGVKKDRMELLDLINQGYTLEQLKERLTASVENVP
jgi:flagellar biosynthesis/type III secretory pathway protein FliH